MPTLPYVPEAYDYGPTSRIAEMMLRAAQQQAQARYANAENLGRGIANVGGAIGDVLQQRQASQQQAAQQAELGRQDAALFALMEQNPDAGLVDYVRIAGPDRGAKVFQAQAAARKMTTVPPDQALKLLPIALDGYFAIPPGPGRARAYDNLRQVAGQSGLPVQGFPEQWDEQSDQILADVQSRLRAQGEGVAQVDTVDDAGNPVTRFVPKQAGASYAKPKPEPRLDSRGFEARIADAVARGDTAAAASLRQEAARLAAAGRAPQQPDTPTVGTLEAYTIGKFGPRPTPEQQLQARVEFEAAGKTPTTGKPISAEAAKVLSIAETLPGELEQIKSAFKATYVGSVAGIETGINRKLVKLVDQAADKVGRLRSGGAINKDEEARFKAQLSSIRDLAFGNEEDAIAALDGLIAEANLVSQSIRGGAGVNGPAGPDTDIEDIKKKHGISY